MLLTLVQCYYSNAYPRGLFRVGYVAFLDMGRPLQDGPEVKSWEITLSGRTRF